MSIEQNVPNDTIINGDFNGQEEGHFVIDAIHGRFQSKRYIYCDSCSSNIAWDHVAIRNHFNNLHPSNQHCKYCEGKVFMYRIIIKEDDKQSSDEKVYHKCEKQQAEIGSQIKDTDSSAIQTGYQNVLKSEFAKLRAEIREDIQQLSNRIHNIEEKISGVSLPASEEDATKIKKAKDRKRTKSG